MRYNYGGKTYKKKTAIISSVQEAMTETLAIKFIKEVITTLGGLKLPSYKLIMQLSLEILVKAIKTDTKKKYLSAKKKTQKK